MQNNNDTLVSHKINEVNDNIKITPVSDSATDCPLYVIEYGANDMSQELSLHFQNGPVKEVGFNGITNEALLAVVEDRLKRFQSGQYACRENALALTKLQEVLHWLHHRTKDRVLRGVEGRNEK